MVQFITFSHSKHLKTVILFWLKIVENSWFEFSIPRNISHLSASMASFNRAGSKVGLEGSNAEAPQDTALDEHCLSISN